MNPYDFFIALLELAILGTAYRIATNNSVKSVIRAYRWQSYFLALATGITAFLRLQVPVQKVVLSLGIALLPFILGRIIEPLLIRATVYTPPTTAKNDVSKNLLTRLKNLFRALRELLQPPLEFRLAAERIWLQQKSKRSSSEGLVFLLMLALIWGVASRVIPNDLSKQLGLVVSLTLHLVGLYTTVKKSDIITQVIGLLTMDHGLYLAVVKIVAIPVPANFLVTALYAYTMITVAILVVMVPQVSHFTQSIDLDEVTKRSALKG